MLTVELGIAKTNKYASRDSGDTAEVVERPGGGLSVVLVYGQGSGTAAKMLSNALASKAVTMLKEGARDGAVARATHDYLHHYRQGQVSATLDIASIDLVSQTLVFSRNSHCPLLVRDDDGVRTIGSTAVPIGPHRHTRPEIVQLALVAGTQVVLFSDGILHAGERYGPPFDVASLLVASARTASATQLADDLLAAALLADHGRPGDDMTVICIAIQPRADDHAPLIRRMTVILPVTVRPSWLTRQPAPRS